MLSLNSDKTALQRYKLSNTNVARELRTGLNFGVILRDVEVEAVRIERLFSKFMKNIEN